MSTTEIKERLIRKIKSTSDERILLEAGRLLEIQLNEMDTPFKLSDEMKKAIDEAQAQIKSGDFLTHENANKEMDEWLGK